MLLLLLLPFNSPESCRLLASTCETVAAICCTASVIALSSARLLALVAGEASARKGAAEMRAAARAEATRA